MLSFQEMVRQTRVQYCLDCGKCTSVCPVSRFDSQFSPRLIVQNALRNKGRTDNDRSIWSCLGCNMCSLRCNDNVNYVDFIRYLRMLSRKSGTELMHSHNEIPESLMHLMGKPEIKQSRQAWVPVDIRVEPAFDTAFFVGCSPYFDIIFKDIGVKTTESSIGAMRVLNRAGTSFCLVPNERCCGHDLLLSGDVEGFIDLARVNMEEFGNRGIRRIVVSCPECYYTLKVDYARHFKDWNLEVLHVMELPEVLAMADNNSGARLPKKVTYHDSCRLGRYFQIYDAPRRLVSSMTGVEMVEMEGNRDSSMCCGASPWMFCGSVNKQIQDERLRQARATGASYLLTSCPKCQIHLKCAQVAGTHDGEQVNIVDIFHFVSQNMATKENE